METEDINTDLDFSQNEIEMAFIVAELMFRGKSLQDAEQQALEWIRESK